MSLSELASIGSFASGIAVLISLIYLALQIRQAEKNQRAIIQQARATRASDFSLFTANPGIADVWARGLAGDETFTLAELRQYMAIFRAMLNNMEDSFFQHRSRLLKDDAFESSMSLMRAGFGTLAWKTSWALIRTNFSKPFRDFIDQAAREAHAPPRDFLTAWKEGIAAEKAAVGRATVA